MEVNGQLYTPATLPPGKEPPVTNWVGVYVCPNAGLDTVVKKTFPFSAETRSPDHPARSPALYH